MIAGFVGVFTMLPFDWLVGCKQLTVIEQWESVRSGSNDKNYVFGD